MRTIKVTFTNGDQIITDINGTDKEIEEYYLNNFFNLSPYREDGREDQRVQGERIEYLED